jgi:hypothetical protein
MRVRLGVALTSAIIIAVGFIVLISLLAGDNLGFLSNLVNAPITIPILQIRTISIRFLGQVILQIATVLLALTVLIGVLNLTIVHLLRFLRGQGSIINRINSVVLLVAFFGTLLLYIAERASNNTAPDRASRLIFTNVLLTVETALAALVFFALVYGAVRMLRQRVTAFRVLFVLTVLVVLIGALPIAQLDFMARLNEWLFNVPVNAGARGILLGIGLATLVTGVRVLIGQDRAYQQE